jgi:TetR/AcrR family transcriptional regulator
MAVSPSKRPPTRKPAKAARQRKTRDAALAQEAILGVARAHFVARGLAGARVDEIAVESGYSKAMIYHYYGNKENLYVAVLEEVYKRFVAPRRVVDVAKVGPVRALEEFIREGADSVRKDPAILNLLSIENLNQAAYLRSSVVPRSVYPPLLLQLKEILEAGVKGGVFRTGIDPVHLYVALSSIIFHAVSNRFTLSVTLGANVAGNEFLDRHIDIAVAMVIGYCTMPDVSVPRRPRRRTDRQTR